MGIQQILAGAGGRPLTVEDLNYPYSGTWTAPAGVTDVNLKLIGSAAHPADWYAIHIRAVWDFVAAGWPPNYATESPTQTSAVALCNTWLTHARTIIGTSTAARYVSGTMNITNGSYTNLAGTTHTGITVGNSTYWWGTLNNQYLRGNLGTSSYTYASFGQGVGTSVQSNSLSGSSIEYQATAQAGGASTFGSYSAAGAPAGGTPTTLEQAISVTPGQSYSYVRHLNQQYSPYRSTLGTVQVSYYA